MAMNRTLCILLAAGALALAGCNSDTANDEAAELAMSRVVGEPGTASGETTMAVVIDSVGPLLAKRSGVDDGVYIARGWDVVSKDGIKIAFGQPVTTSPPPTGPPVQRPS